MSEEPGKDRLVRREVPQDGTVGKDGTADFSGPLEQLLGTAGAARALPPAVRARVETALEQEAQRVAARPLNAGTRQRIAAVLEARRAERPAAGPRWRWLVPVLVAAAVSGAVAVGLGSFSHGASIGRGGLAASKSSGSVAGHQAPGGARVNAQQLVAPQARTPRAAPTSTAPTSTGPAKAPRAKAAPAKGAPAKGAPAKAAYGPRGTAAVPQPRPHGSVAVRSAGLLRPATVSPARGPRSGGNWVVVTGSGLEAVRAVHFGGTTAAQFDVISASRLRVRVPPHASGTVAVKLSGTGGRLVASPGLTYRYEP